MEDILQMVRNETVYVRWINGKSQPVDEPFVTVTDLTSIIDTVLSDQEDT